MWSTCLKKYLNTCCNFQRSDFALHSSLLTRISSLASREHNLGPQFIATQGLFQTHSTSTCLNRLQTQAKLHLLKQTRIFPRLRKKRCISTHISITKNWKIVYFLYKELLIWRSLVNLLHFLPWKQLCGTVNPIHKLTVKLSFEEVRFRIVLGNS